MLWAFSACPLGVSEIKSFSVPPVVFSAPPPWVIHWNCSGGRMRTFNEIIPLPLRRQTPAQGRVGGGLPGVVTCTPRVFSGCRLPLWVPFN